jgi:hypothetical protein
VIYFASITTPANTLMAAPLDTALPVIAGLIYHIKIIFPPGGSGLVHVQIFDAAYQVWPTTQGTSFRGDNLMFSYDELYDKSEPPLQLTVRTWNLDDYYDHEIDVHIAMVSREEYKSRFLPGLGMTEMTSVLSTITQTQAARRQESIDGLVKQFGRVGRK